MVGRGSRLLLSALPLLVAASIAPAENLSLTYLSGAPPPRLLDGTASAARFNDPSGLAVDREGNIFVAETGSHVIRKIAPDGAVSTLAGRAGEPGTADGPPGQGRLTSPRYLTVDPDGSVYVSDNANRTIRRIGPDGSIRTLAGLVGAAGNADGTGGDARFNQPTGVAFSGGNLYVMDQSGSRIRRVTPDGKVSTLPLLTYGANLITASPDGTVYFLEVSKFSADLSKLQADGTRVRLAFSSVPIVSGITADANGNVFVLNAYDYALYRFHPSSGTKRVAGGTRGWQDGSGPDAGFAAWPGGIAADASGNVLLADRGTNTVRKISPGGVISTVAGHLEAPTIPDRWTPIQIEGPANQVRFLASGLAVDGSGRLAVADRDLVFTAEKDGTVSVLAGQRGAGQERDGTGSEALFLELQGIASDARGNLYVTGYTETVRKITPQATVTTLAGEFGKAGSDDGPGTSARFQLPTGIASTPEGVLFVSDFRAHTVRRIEPDGTVSTIAGSAGQEGTADGLRSDARFSYPTAVAVSPSGDVFVADGSRRQIRKISPSGLVTTFAGKSSETGNADGPGDEARFSGISSLTTDPVGNLYTADAGALRRITPGGTVTTIRTELPISLVQCDRSGNLSAYSAGTLFRIPSPLDDHAWIDARFGPAGVRRQLDAPPASAASWEWRLVQRPSASRASLATSERSPVFVPDVEGLFIFELAARNGDRLRVSQTSLIASAGIPRSLVLSSGRVSVALEWRNPYDGSSGQAHSTPAGGQHGFFWYEDPDNPEIFVKVLDFGSEEPFLLFWGGLTDFEYTIRFTGLETGAVFEAHHPAGSLDGGVARLPRAASPVTAPAPLALPRTLPLTDEAGERKPNGVVLSGEVSVSVAWRSQYDGSTGTASAIATGEALGQFWFFKPENPEVSVKVLDWGSDRPYLLFWTGLTDFEYSVMFTNLRTGQTATFVKEAGRVGGGIDTTTLLH